MSKPAAGSWCVRFLSGTLRGRTIALRAGTNVVGSAGDCEIMLAGDDVLPRHLLFSVGDIAVSLRKFGTATVQLNGEALSAHRRSAVRGDVISLGDIEFELARLEAGAEADMPALPGAALQRSAAAASDAAHAPQSKVARATTKAPPRYRAGALIAAAVAGMAISTGIGLRAFETTAGRTTIGGAMEQLPLDALERSLQDFSDVTVTKNPDGTATVKGYVRSEPRKAALLQALEPFHQQVSVNVYVTEDMLQRARTFLDEPDLAVSYAGQGRLVVSGTVANEAVRQKINRLRQDLLPAVVVLDHVYYAGSESSDPQKALSAWKSTLPSPMVGLTEYANGMRQIQLANGKRYYEGATLESGELTNIEAERLVVTSSGTGKAPGANPLADKQRQ